MTENWSREAYGDASIDALPAYFLCLGDKELKRYVYIC